MNTTFNSMMKLALLVILVASYVTASESIDCECGLSRSPSIFTSFIYRGNTSQADRYPWMAYIKVYPPVGSEFLECGGTLIDDQHVLTAAHCLYTPEGKLAEVKDIVLFLNLVDKPWHHRAAIPVASYVYHEGFDPNNDWIMANDIAVIKLAQPISKASSISAICLPKAEKQSYEKLTIAGYGVLDAKGSETDTLQQVEVNLIPREKCEAQRSDFVEKMIRAGKMDKEKIPYLTESHLCAINEATRGDSCLGDSGGPMMYQNPKNGRWYIIGVVSGSWTDCGHPDVPGLYSSVEKFTDFIRANTNKPCFRSL